MSTATTTDAVAAPLSEGDDLDVLIVGAGLSGIDAACRLQMDCPRHRFAIVEARERLGGTWDLFRYPGIRSDSDMYTLGFPFRPWRGDNAIAGGAEILQYLRATAAEHGVDRKIAYRHRVRSASWSSEQARWTVAIERDGDARPITLRCRFLFMCSGYYDYGAGYQPDFPGRADFGGRFVHPQFWPDDLDVCGRHVVIVGSGATAMTLAPALAASGAQVTLLQRSPTYVIALPARDRFASALHAALPERIAQPIARWRNLLLGTALFRLCRQRPQRARARLLAGVRAALGPDYDVATHFSPRYDPWLQRLCVVPDGDLFDAIRAGRVTMVTDTIDRFTPRGIRLASGRELDADIVVSATGLQLRLLGGVQVSVDGRPVEPGDLVFYKGTMFRDLPNFALTMGYTNASWTLKADLTSRWVCRVLRHMERTGARRCTPRAADAQMPLAPWVDFSSGYFQRALDRTPRQGLRKPWQLNQDYLADLLTLRFGRIADGLLEFA